MKMKKIKGSVTAPQGFLAQGVCADLKKTDKKDIALIYSEVPCIAVGTFTTNVVRASSVDISRQHLSNGRAQAIVANSGNANACTGEQGWNDTLLMAQITGQGLNIDPRDVVVASTGVIGANMCMEKIEKGIRQAAANLSPEDGYNAAQAIMTTDLISKEIAVEIELQGKPVRIGAIAKGSGMIHPNMATMLAFFTTDACLENICLEKAFKQAVKQSFNMISVDRDTSTNDMAVILANGLAGNPVINDVDSDDYKLFQEALQAVAVTLAKLIARDGEGATCMIEVQVKGASTQENARQIARSITGSNLTKAAVFGRDANWGRILAAAGYSGVEFDPNRVDIYLGGEKMAENGMGLHFDEEQARRELEKDPVVITVDLKSGSESAVAWGCDLSYDYVKINASYRS